MVAEEISQAPLSKVETTDTSNEWLDVELPKLGLEIETQIPTEVLLSAWTLLLHRGSVKPSETKLAWGTYLQNGDSEAERVEASLRDVISEAATAEPISKVQDAIREVLQRESSAVPNGMTHGGMEESRILYAKAVDAEWSISIETRISWSHFSVRRHTPTSDTDVPTDTLSPHMFNVHISAFLDILTSVISNPSQTITESLRVGPRELTHLWDWNTPVPEYIPTPLHNYFCEFAQKDPNRAAVLSWDGAFTYGELDQLSTRLAVKLVKNHNITVGSIIPCNFEKSAWTAIAVIAIMKAGAAFALTDPHQPEARLKTIADEVAAKVVLTSVKQAELGERIKPEGATVVAVGPELWNEQEEIDTSVLPTEIPGESPLYIIFTSGSTGKPKGVMISHANYTSGALPRAEAVGYKPHSRVLDFASYAFDVSIDCMLCTLSHGGCICVPSDDQRMNDIAGAIRGMNVNMAHMTPSVARVLDPATIAALEVIGLGGEEVAARDAAIWNQSTNVVIAYGPSECTVGCTINNAIRADKVYTSIGKGVGGALWLVDADDHEILTPIGAVGELIVEGPVVGLGYINQPDKTAEVFIEDPTWLVAGASNSAGRHGRFYKTGDLVKYDPDGSGDIVFVGRKDQQVKLRGQRVELGEIEYHLGARLPKGTTIAVEVITPGRKTAEPTLVAFISEVKEKGRPEDEINAEPEIISFSEEVQAALGEMDQALGVVLPVYMVPTAYIPLQKIPKLVSLKIDRKKLREFGLSISQQQLAKFRVTNVKKTAPSSDMELRVHGLWAQMFGSDIEIGIEENFFAIGGDSLRAMKLVAAARADGLALTVADIFMNPTLGGMANVIKEAKTEAEAEIHPFSLLPADWTPEAARAVVAKLSVDLDTASVEDIYLCTPLQEGLMALSAKSNNAYVASRVVEVKDLETAQRLQEAFNVAVADLPIMRTRIVQVPARGLVQVVVNEKIPWKTSGNLEEYLEWAQETPMELGVPLSRYGLVHDEAAEKFYIVLTIHHALYDGWSMPLVVDRINKAYQKVDTETRPPFKAFLQYLHNMDRSSAEQYWRERLQGATGLQFPVIPFIGYQPQADSLLEHYVTFNKPLSSGTTLATAIRGAWALVASQYLASDDVVFGETLTGRNVPVPGVELVEGPMITTVPVRVKVDRKTVISEYLQSIHDQTVLRIPHEHMGLQHIRRLSPDAREACELRTGLVLHPNTEEADKVEAGDDSPASAFIPANDSEAAKEALKFNSYALMLVCTLDKDGFLIMASFDSKTVEMSYMDKAMKKLGNYVQLLAANPEKTIGDIEEVDVAEHVAAWEISESAAKSVVASGEEVLGESCEDFTAAWIVDSEDAENLLPIGAIGELLLEKSGDSAAASIDAPTWLKSGINDIPGRLVKVYKTGQLVRYTTDGGIEFLGKKEERIKAPSQPAPRQILKSNFKPTTETEKKLLEIWSRVLGLPEDEISVTDSFFELGGDSIGAMKIVSEARLEELGEITVAQIFKHRKFADMVKLLKESEPVKPTTEEETPVVPFATLKVENVEKFIEETVRPALVDPSWKIVDVYPARPLQKIAVHGTFKLPRYSSRYELFYFDNAVDRTRLFSACQEVIARNEILRTVWVEDTAGVCYSVVLESLIAAVDEFEIEGDLQSFCQKLTDVDIQTTHPLGGAFVKFLFVSNKSDGKSCLLFRISHAQYDEMCLPLILTQLSAIYENRPVVDTIPFSRYVNYALKENIPIAIPYWRDLLAGSKLSVLPQPAPLVNRDPIFINKTFSLAGRSKSTTIATLPTAAWALTLARRLQTSDVTFGEVVTGRNTGFSYANTVMGPTWNYVPVRVRFTETMTISELLETIQTQHMEAMRFEAIGLSEIIEHCTNWGEEGIDWFDSVVHQDVEHVEQLGFGVGGARMDTIYPHLEPLREWKVQAFLRGEEMIMEVVTFKEWEGRAWELLEEVGGALEELCKGKQEGRVFANYKALGGEEAVVGEKVEVKVEEGENKGEEEEEEAVLVEEVKSEEVKEGRERAKTLSEVILETIWPW